MKGVRPLKTVFFVCYEVLIESGNCGYTHKQINHAQEGRDVAEAARSVHEDPQKIFKEKKYGCNHFLSPNNHQRKHQHQQRDR